MNAVLKPDKTADLRGRRPCARRLGPQGDRHRRDRDARPHGDPRGIRRRAAAQGRPHHRLAAHDDPDRRPHRDAEGARRRRALGLVQHLLDAGPRRRRHRQGRHRRLRGEGRVARRVLGLHPPHLRVAGRRLHEHDPGRRRRRDAAAAPGRARRDRRQGPRQSRQRGGDLPLRLDQGEARQGPEVVLHAPRQGEGRDRGDHHGRAPPLPDGEGGHAQVPGHQRERLGHQEQVRQPLRLPRVAGGRHQARHRRDDRRQGRPRRGLRRRGQGLRRRRCAPSRPRCGSPRSTPSARCRPRWKATAS